MIIFDDDIAAFPTLSGSIDAVFIRDAQNEAVLKVSGLDAELADFIAPADATLNWEAFWKTMLAGDDTINFPLTSNKDFTVLSDVATVHDQEPAFGGDDASVHTLRVRLLANFAIAANDRKAGSTRSILSGR